MTLPNEQSSASQSIRVSHNGRELDAMLSVGQSTYIMETPGGTRITYSKDDMMKFKESPLSHSLPILNIPTKSEVPTINEVEDQHQNSGNESEDQFDF
ncbi:hypothetical protein P9112_000339 [Eukaryota sp. TZLM1-RC]